LKYDFLRKDWIYLQTIVDSGKSCFGVCCGGQILAKLLGGQVLKSPMKEIGGYQINLTYQGTHDPLFSGFSRTFPVFQWHSDMFTVPSGGELLATSEPCYVQSFRKGNIWGVMFHLEITSKDAQRWVNAYSDEPNQIGKTRDQVLDECRMNEDEMGQLASRLMKNFLSQ
jgi:GMP synthase (glutamine-hydrolysing)